MVKVALFGQKTSTSLEDVITPFLNFLSSHKVNYCIEEKFLQTISVLTDVNLTNVETFTSYEDLDKTVKLFFTFGGDGTILSAATIVKDSQIPIVGVNTGRLGFLATINKSVLLEQLENFFNGNYHIIPRSLLKIERNDGVEIKDNYAINEITVTRRETTSMITIDTYLDGEFLNSFWSDGLIISTPTGSTGYNLSCGGPIVHPSNQNFIITPVAPHNLNVRPLIVSENSCIDLKIRSRANEYFLSLDSRNLALTTDVELRISKAEFKINIVEANDASYFTTLRDKMLWGSDKRN
ncbi:NAD kinase [Faecalibacter rhinopitheci]|uniref:NAD kinase n=1 Tax=Faecalibacter rhinopitheci TaxID=2779678 RepID=A0A8J7KD23_9FLAO|nr:NAD kinase [Faecalibacter rhinopitheci]MBF0596851.1 NAD kinase [Faecalibacter rhinopitheci]MBQ0148262.1 NAD kinase [Candidatus Onthonaster equi]